MLGISFIASLYLFRVMYSLFLIWIFTFFAVFWVKCLSVILIVTSRKEIFSILHHQVPSNHWHESFCYFCGPSFFGILDIRVVTYYDCFLTFVGKEKRKSAWLVMPRSSQSNILDRVYITFSLRFLIGVLMLCGENQVTRTRFTDKLKSHVSQICLFPTVISKLNQENNGSPQYTTPWQNKHWIILF